MSQLHLISYISRTVPDFDRHWPDIAKMALEKNPAHGITGVLFHNQNLVLQVLEGEKKHVVQLMDNIRNDKRHYEIEIIIDAPIKERGFDSWTMDTFDVPNDIKLEKEMLVQIGRDYREIVKPRADMFIKFYKATLGIDI